MKESAMRDGKGAVLKGLENGLTGALPMTAPLGQIAEETAAEGKNYGAVINESYKRNTMPLMGDFPDVFYDHG